MEPSDRLTLFIIVAVVVFLAQTLKRGQWRIPQLFGLALVVVAIGGYFAHKHREQTRKAQEQAQEEAVKRAEFESRISAYATKHNAVADWQKPLLAKGKAETVYSAELAPLLVRPDGRPVLVFAMLRNVSESGGQAVIYFDDATTLESRFKLQLDCSPEQAHPLTEDHAAYRFAVIAQVRSVDYVPGGDYSLATGRCVDAMSVDLSDYLEFVVVPALEKQVHHSGGG
jgi:hypothetical protein